MRIFLYQLSAISRLDGIVYVSLNSVAHLQLLIGSTFCLGLKLCVGIVFLYFCGVVAVFCVIRSCICLSRSTSPYSRFRGFTITIGIKVTVFAKDKEQKNYSN